jgi:hypothetical protein
VVRLGDHRTGPGLADIIYGLLPVLVRHLLISGGYNVITMAGHEEEYTITDYGEFFLDTLAEPDEDRARWTFRLARIPGRAWQDFDRACDFGHATGTPLRPELSGLAVCLAVIPASSVRGCLLIGGRWKWALLYLRAVFARLCVCF